MGKNAKDNDEIFYNIRPSSLNFFNHGDNMTEEKIETEEEKIILEIYDYLLCKGDQELWDILRPYLEKNRKFEKILVKRVAQRLL